VQSALPDAVNAMLASIERCGSLQELIKTGVNVSSYLKAHPVVQEMLSKLGSLPTEVNLRFLQFKSNPTSIAMLRMYLPQLLTNIPLLFSMLPMFLNSITQNFGPFGGSPFPFPGAPFPNHPPPFAFGPWSPPTGSTPSRTPSSQESQELVHYGVRCDGCNCEPIRGVRYKCSVCSNYDLCQQCETKNVHSEHSFLKIRDSETASEAGSESIHSESLWGRGSPGGWGRGRWFRGMGHHHPMHQRMHSMRGRFGSLCGAQAQDWRCRDKGDKGDKLKVKFVENVTIPERAVVLPGQTLIKTWRVENTGKSDWPENCRLAFRRGERSMSTEADFPVPVCKVGQSVEISAVIVTPTQPGRHSAVFRLADPERIPFGPRLWCDVIVAHPSGSFPRPSAPMATVPMETKDNSQPMQSPSPESSKEDPKPAPQEKYSIQLCALASMGFKNTELNRQLLEKHNGNVQTVCDYLLNLRSS